MDLIYTNAVKEDQGVLLNYELDLAFGDDENDFECKIQTESHCCGAGSYLYIEGTEYGGIIDGLVSNTSLGEVTYLGRTWHGILNSKVITPDRGLAYLVLSGEANSVIGSLVERLGLSDLFEASSEDSGLFIRNYKMNRYITGYDGIKKMLETVNGKLLFRYQDGRVIVSASEKHDYSSDEEIDSDMVDFKISKKYKTVNHLVCLGSGELENRMVVDLYADTNGNISRKQTFFGIDEYAAVYDFSNVESEEELVNSGTDALKSMMEASEVTVDLDDTSVSYDVGDIVGAYDNITGISAIAEITKKIVTIKNGQTTISYKVGE